MSKPSIFIHSLFRTGSTYLWNKFRQDKNYYCFYEPLHHILAQVSTINIQYMMTTDFKAVHHPELDKYYLEEYMPLLSKGQTGLPYFKKEFSYDQFCMNTGDENPGLKQYIDSLLNSAAGKIAVLKFNRTAFRTGWFKKNFPLSAHIYLNRNPRDQWQSYNELFQRKKNSLFFLMDLLIASVNRDNAVFDPLSKIIPLVRYSSPNQDNENDFYRIALRSYSDEERYCIFYYIWFNAFIKNVCDAILFIDIDLLSEDISYKNKLTELLRERHFEGIHFDDAKIEHYSHYTLPINTMDEIETKIQQLSLQSLTLDQIDGFFRDIPPEGEKFLKLQREDFIDVKKKNPSPLLDFREIELDKLEKLIVQLESKFSMKTDQTRVLETETVKKKMELNNRTRGVNEKNNILDDEENEILQKMGETQKKDILLLLKDEHLRQKDLIITENMRVISQKDWKVQRENLLIMEKNKLLKLKDKIIAEKDRELLLKEDELRDKDLRLTEKAEDIEQKNTIIAEKDRELLRKDSEIDDNNMRLLELNAELKQKEAVINKKLKSIKWKKNEVKQKELQLLKMKEELTQLSSQLQKISNSLTFRTGKIVLFPAKILKRLISKMKATGKRAVATLHPISQPHPGYAGNFEKKINISNQLKINFGTHRSGLKYGLDYLNSLHNPNGVVFDAFIERTFCWNPDGITPHLTPWIGIIHVPPKIPLWFNYQQSNEMIFKTEAWGKSLPYCKGLFTLSKYHQKYLEPKLGIPVNSLFLPTEVPNIKWTWEKFAANKEKKIIQVGWWLRRLHAIYQLPRTDYKKIFLDINHKSLPRLLKAEKEILLKEGEFDDSMYNTVETIDFLTDNEYDKLLSENIVFIHLYDSSANNIISECIVRNTPILVNPLESVIEYLGEEYPFYFNSYEEASNKMTDFELILKTHLFLKNHPTKEKMSGEYFLKSVTGSKIYRSL